MAVRETFAQRKKRELDLQLDEELEGTFPASDPPKITRFSVQIPPRCGPSTGKRYCTKEMVEFA